MKAKNRGKQTMSARFDCCDVKNIETNVKAELRAKPDVTRLTAMGNNKQGGHRCVSYVYPETHQHNFTQTNHIYLSSSKQQHLFYCLENKEMCLFSLLRWIF